MKKLNYFFFNKKGSANMWWIIIGAVIALVILVVLMVIFTSRTQPLNEELGNCVSKGGVCAVRKPCPKGTLPAGSFTCSEGSCCLGAPKVCTVGGGECPGECVEFDRGISYCK